MVITGPKDHAEGFLEASTCSPRPLVPQCAGPARHPGGARRLSEHRGPGTARWAPARAARRRVGAPQRHPGRELREAARCALRLPASGSGVYDIHDDEKLVQDLLLQERILVTQARASTGRTTTICASSRCRGHATWRWRSSGSVTSCPPTNSRNRASDPGLAIVAEQLCCAFRDQSPCLEARSTYPNGQFVGFVTIDTCQPLPNPGSEPVICLMALSTTHCAGLPDRSPSPCARSGDGGGDTPPAPRHHQPQPSRLLASLSG